MPADSALPRCWVRSDLKIRTTPTGFRRPRNRVEPGDPSGRFGTALSGKGDDGVILVFWLLTLTALFGFMALAINLGNLLQSTDNVQNAVDSAAVSGASSLAVDPQSPSPLLHHSFPLWVRLWGQRFSFNGVHWRS